MRVGVQVDLQAAAGEALVLGHGELDRVREILAAEGHAGLCDREVLRGGAQCG